MRPLISLIRREFTAYFLSPIAYVTLAVFQVITGALFYLTLTKLTEAGPRGIEYPMQLLFGGSTYPVEAMIAGVFFWFLLPALTAVFTMRLLAEERARGTLEMLLTAPIRDWQVVAGKYIACFLFYIVLWLPTLLYIPVLVDLDWSTGAARLDYWPVITSYAGAITAGAMFLAVGFFVSSQVQDQLVAWMLSMLVGLVFIVPGYVAWYIGSGSRWYPLTALLGVPEHFRRDFSRGVIDTRHLVLYLSVTVFCLFLTVRSLEARRLRS
ncbi:ABC transporter permease subunit [Fimbriiglobus ruber]|uniref:Gliding motility protein GldF n=1 Tax=Fimbriiglobus ruber TaxID=1908690 RepID=A0A225DJ18_9BACT|nr:ABC transporter permease subunit [Fimbriiglobus ruber]OWK38568.1 gliding motility protein GldF [Fimbriiglobus ruber]